MKIILVLIITSLVFVRCTDQTSIVLLLILLNLNQQYFLIFVNSCNKFNKILGFFAQLLGEDLPYYTETDYVKFKDVGSIYYHLILKEGTANLEAIQKGDVLAVWLNGGPGSSSQLGMGVHSTFLQIIQCSLKLYIKVVLQFNCNYMEIGPWVIKKNPDTEAKDKPYIVTKREYSWNKAMHLLFIDQPFGAGMSKADKENVVTNSDEAAKYFVETLKFSEYLYFWRELCRPLHIIKIKSDLTLPAFATRLLQDKDTLDKVNFKGIAIIDGITDTENQLNYYHSYLYSIGAISQLDLDRLQKIGAVGQSSSRNGEYAKGAEQLGLMTEDKFIEQIGGINVYNIRKYQGLDEYDYSWADFLNNYIKQFSSEITQFQKSNPQIYKAFQQDIGESRLKDIQLLLERQYKVLLLNGQLDYIINTPGAWNWIYQIDWKYKYQWKNAKKQFITFPVQGEENKVETHGYIKTFENFSYATIYKAGHMIPTDNPKAAYQVIENFIK